MFRATLCPSSGAREYYTSGCCLSYLVLGFQAVAIVWSCGLCVRFAGCTYYRRCTVKTTSNLTICMLHYNPRHVSSINMPIFRRTNFIITASGIVTLCKRLYSMMCSLLSSGILNCTVQRVTITDAVIIKFVLLKMGILILETCRGLNYFINQL
jgi:hypothetical protein